MDSVNRSPGGRSPKWEGVEGRLCPGRQHADDVRQRTGPGQEPARRVRGSEWVRVCLHLVPAREAVNGDRLGWPAEARVRAARHAAIAETPPYSEQPDRNRAR